MNKLNLWDFSRLKQAEAWKRALCADTLMIIPSGIVLVVGLPMFSEMVARPLLFNMAAWALWGSLALLCILRVVCEPDDGFLSCFGPDCAYEKACKVRVYEHQNLKKEVSYEMQLKSADGRHWVLWAHEYDCVVFAPDARCFIYRMLGEANWYLVNPEISEPQLLGKRLGKSIFLAPVAEGSKGITLRLLQISSVHTVCADSFIYGNIYLPPVEGKKIMPDSSRIPVNLMTQKRREAVADEYLLLKKNGEYDLIGLYTPKDEMPYCLSTIAPAVIFREDNQTVILLSRQGGGYKEYYRGANIIRKADDSILELYNKGSESGLYGKLYRFNPKNSGLDLEYDGRVFGIDFDKGEVVCENGMVYKP